jgi:hypothetical protein
MQQIKLQKQECKREKYKRLKNKEGRAVYPRCLTFNYPDGLSWATSGVNRPSFLVLLAELFETLVNKHERHFYFESLDFDTAFNCIPVPRG